MLAQATSVEDVTPYIGTELKGIQLSKLSNEQKDELALLVAEVRTALCNEAHRRGLLTITERCGLFP